MNKEVTIDIENPKDNDLISRQAVLEGIRNLYPDIPVVDIMGARRKWLEKYAPYFECENVVEQLPSVTPEQDTVSFDFELYQQGLMNMPKGMIEVLDKIRAEIEQSTSRYSISKECGGMGHVEWSDRLIKESNVLQIIDKYMTGGEDKE